MLYPNQASAVTLGPTPSNCSGTPWLWLFITFQKAKTATSAFRRWRLEAPPPQQGVSTVPTELQDAKDICRFGVGPGQVSPPGILRLESSGSDPMLSASFAAACRGQLF